MYCNIFTNETTTVDSLRFAVIKQKNTSFKLTPGGFFTTKRVRKIEMHYEA